MRYRADIDGLRALAVGIVVFSHLQVAGFGGGFVGVDIFFVISGFLITTYLVEQIANNSLSLREFYFRRARRILPMALLVLAATTAAGLLLLNTVKATQIALDSFWSALFLENLHLIQQSADYFNHAFSVSAVQHYWSLAVEEQFYLIFPISLTLLVKLFGRRKNWLTHVVWLISLVAVASLVSAILQGGSAANAAYFSSATRAYELAIGALLACAVFAQRLKLNARWSSAASTLGLAAMLAANFLVTGEQGYPGAIALLPTLGAALFIAGGVSKPHGWVTRAFSARPVVFVGKISFSVYLIHWPLIVFVQQLQPDFAASGWFSWSIVTATLGLSTLCYFLVEKPTRRIQLRPRSNRNPMRLATATIAVVGSIGLVSSAWAITGGTWNTAYVPSSNASGSGSDFVPNKPTPTASGSVSPTASATPSPSPTASPSPSPTSTAKPTKPPKPAAEATLDQLLAAWIAKVDAGVALTKVPSDLSPPIWALLNNRGIQWKQCMDPPTHQTTCEFGSASAKHTAVILGDSYALAVYPMVIKALGLQDWHIIGLNQRECMVADITPWPWQGSGADTSCPDHRAWVNDYISQTHPDLVVLSDQPFHPIADGNQDSADNHDLLWQEGLDSELATLRPLAKNIVYFGVPTSSQGLTDCVLAGDVLSDKCTGSPTWLSHYINTQAIYSNRYRIPFINPNDWLCSNGKCPAIIDNTPVFWDGAHFTQDFAAKLGPLFRAFLIENGLMSSK